MSDNKNIDYLIKENIDLINKLIKQNEILISNNDKLVKEMNNIKDIYSITEKTCTQMDIGHCGFGC